MMDDTYLLSLKPWLTRRLRTFQESLDGGAVDVWLKVWPEIPDVALDYGNKDKPHHDGSPEAPFTCYAYLEQGEESLHWCATALIDSAMDLLKDWCSHGE